jgi:hypothetical protein
VSKRRNVPAATRFFETMLAGRDRPREITTDLAAPLLRVVDELLPDVLHDTTQYANNRIECDHGRLKSRLRPMRGLRTDRPAKVVIHGHAFTRICGAVTTNSASKPVTCGYVSRQLSMNSPTRSDRTTRPHRCAAPPDRPTQQCPAAADARSSNGSDRVDGDPRPCVRPESAAR